MKRSITIFTLALVSCMATAQNSNGILQKSKGSITFVVDEDLKPIEDDYPMEESLKSGAYALYGILRDEGVPGDTHAIIARSFSDDEYFYENDGEGLWIYLGKNLQVTITRREDSSIPLEWYETEIRTRNGEAFRSVITDPDHPGKKFQYPYVIARQERFVLGFSDDFFGNRMQKKETVGIIIREGKLISEATNRKTGHHLPNLDMMAQYPDGRLEVYECNEFSAEELLAMDARNVLSFGPLLIRNGEINDLVYDYYKSLEPRQALGMISPNHFFLLSVQGRNSGSRGTTLQRVAEMMKEKGVTEALNLDGGNTMALIFRGRMLNKLAVYKNRKFVRTVPSLLGVGMCQEDFSD